MKKVILIVRDGWGFTEKIENNAILKAQTSFTDSIEKKYPTILINASGEAVGLPEGYMGNSEVGHITMGAGRVVDQSLLRINKEIKSGGFLVNKEILKAIQNIKKNNSSLHLICLLQDAGVHSHISHLFKTLDYARKEGLKQDQVIIHVITDGRDHSPKSGIDFLAKLADKIYETNMGIVATISGRYYAMDRNDNYDRTKLAYDAIFNAEGKKFSCGLEKLEENYKNGITDEFIEPIVKEKYSGVKNNDSVFFVNFRKDRARQLSRAIFDDDFDGFGRIKKDIFFLTMTKYYDDFSGNIVFEDIIPENTLTEVLDGKNKTQLRISETEKYAHVTFFFDGGKEYKSENIRKIIIPSPKVETYDFQPEMSSEELTKKVVLELENEYDFVLLNYPNADMVGHTGNFNATIKAVEIIDKSLEKVVEKSLEKDYIVLVTGDHGNAENVSENFTSHTINKVPFTIISKKNNLKLKDGEYGLSNIAGTILKLLEIKIPEDYNESLLED